MASERIETATVADHGGELRGDQHLATERFAQGLYARDLVDRRNDHRESTDVGVPKHSQDTFDRASLHRPGMDASSGITPEISCEKAGSDRMAGMRHHRKRQGGQYRLQQVQVVITETFRPVACEGV